MCVCVCAHVTTQYRNTRKRCVTIKRIIQMLKLPKCQKIYISLKNKLLKQFKKYMTIQKRNIRKRKKYMNP